MLIQSCSYVVIDKQHCQKFREILGDHKAFNKQRKVVYEGDKVKLPVTFEPGSDLRILLESVSHYSTEVVTDTTVNHSQYDQLVNRINGLTVKVTNSLRGEIPASWEIYGDLLLIPGSSFRDNFWSEHLEAILDIICDVFKVNRVARKRPVNNDEFRSPKTDLLRGKETWVSRRENGITYHFDITRSMFSVGNISEKLRVAKFNCQGETVVDLFAGIGYWVLPFLVT